LSKISNLLGNLEYDIMRLIDSASAA